MLSCAAELLKRRNLKASGLIFHDSISLNHHFTTDGPCIIHVPSLRCYDSRCAVLNDIILEIALTITVNTCTRRPTKHRSASPQPTISRACTSRQCPIYSQTVHKMYIYVPSTRETASHPQSQISFTNLNVTTREFSIVAFESPDR